MTMLRRLAFQSRGRTIGLYGGSFNPPHPGHRHVLTEALKRLDLDEIWVLVSPGNPLKDGAPDMAPEEKRVEKTQEFLSHPKIKVMALEKSLKTRYSAHTLKKLKRIMPLTKFVWIMGADNEGIFHRWYKWREIMAIVPIAIFDRTGYSRAGRQSVMATTFRRHQVAPEKITAAAPPGWCYVDIVRHPASATLIRHHAMGNWWVQG